MGHGGYLTEPAGSRGPGAVSQLSMATTFTGHFVLAVAVAFLLRFGHSADQRTIPNVLLSNISRPNPENVRPTDTGMFLYIQLENYKYEYIFTLYSLFLCPSLIYFLLYMDSLV